jgi:hypothetical protein
MEHWRRKIFADYAEELRWRQIHTFSPVNCGAKMQWRNMTGETSTAVVLD